MDIIIRPYSHPRDMEEIWRVFLSATNTGPGSPIVEKDAHIAPYITAAHSTIAATLALLFIPPLLDFATPPLPILECAAVLFAIISLGLLGYIWDFRRRTNKLSNTFRSDVLKDFQDVVGRWELIMQDGGARCVPNGPNGFWVAEQGGEVIGCVGLRKRQQNVKIGEVARLLVAPNHQRQGVGIRLMEAVATHARQNGVGRLELITSCFNKAAMRMYAKTGWERCGVSEYGGFGMPVWGKDLNQA